MRRAGLYSAVVLFASVAFVLSATGQTIRTIHDDGPLYMKDNKVGSKGINCTILIDLKGISRLDHWAGEAADKLINYYSWRNIAVTFADLVAKFVGGKEVTRESVKLGLIAKISWVVGKALKKKPDARKVEIRILRGKKRTEWTYTPY